MGGGDCRGSVAPPAARMRKQGPPACLCGVASASRVGTLGDLLREAFCRARRAGIIGQKSAPPFPHSLSRSFARGSRQDGRNGGNRRPRNPLSLRHLERGTALSTMQRGPPTDSTSAILGEPQVCGKCQTVSRLTNGLCLNCLLHGALDKEETPSD